MYLIAGVGKILVILTVGWTFKIIIAVINFVYSLFTGKPLLDMSLTGGVFYEAKESTTQTKNAPSKISQVLSSKSKRDL